MTLTYREQAEMFWRRFNQLDDAFPITLLCETREVDRIERLLAAALQAQGERVEALQYRLQKNQDAAFEDIPRRKAIENERDSWRRTCDKLQQQLATVEQVNQRVMQLEVVIRKSCGPELNCLSNMGIGFIEKAVYWYQQQLATCEARVWEAVVENLTMRGELRAKLYPLIDDPALNAMTKAYQDEAESIIVWCKARASREKGKG